VLLAYPPGRVRSQVGAENRIVTNLARAVIALAQAFQGAFDVIEHPLGLGQIVLVALFHHGRVPRHRQGAFPILGW
jgi:hypothetical protein